MTDKAVIAWLLEGDASIRYQVRRDLLGTNDRRLQSRIAKEGWGARILACRGEDGNWGRGFYTPKWTSTHYTLVDLRALSLPPRHRLVQSSIRKILRERRAADGGINPSPLTSPSDVCICGMFLAYASYFETDERELRSVVDLILSQRMSDGGFNCRLNRSGAVHSSLHTTISVAEGIDEYARKGYAYRLKELRAAEASSREFMLEHRLFRSHRTGDIIDRKFLTLSHPSRWRYDILRALEYFYFAGAAYDERMSDALAVLRAKQRPDGAWPLQAKHAGAAHFDMELAGQPSRWNTLRAMRVLRHFAAVKKVRAKGGRQ